MKRLAHAAYPIDPLFEGRWSPRAFSAQPVPPMVIRTLLEAARWAPSCFNDQPWRFLVAARESDPAGHARLAACLFEANRIWGGKAPVLMLSVAPSRFAATGKPNAWARHDLGLAVGQLITQATAEGLFTHQMGGFDAEQARRELGIPDDHEPVAVIGIGYLDPPDELPADLRARELAPRHRNPQDDFAFGAKWGEQLTTAADYQRVLHYWFGAIDADGLADAQHAAAWWRKDPQLDAQIRQRFAVEHAAAVAGQRDAWLTTPRGRLAWIILLDQFSRNMFRDTAAMFAHDAAALQAARDGIAHGEDETLRTDERAFIYLPLMHSESLFDQDTCVARFAALHDKLEGAARERIGKNLEFAHRHREIIARFGRFPHRNTILGRPSTTNEQAFLEQPGSSF